MSALIDNTSARRAVLVMTLICLALSAVAVVRLGVSVAASPGSLLLVEPVRYIEPSVRTDPATVARADAAASMLADAGLIRSRIEHCRVEVGRTIDPARCLAVVDDALRASPASGELWLLRATLLAQFGEFGDPLRTALRNSFAAAPLEGWIVVPRLGLELRLYPTLPADLREQARTDLGGVLADPVQAHTLAAGYAHDPAMRAAGKPAFDGMPPELVTRFVAFVRDAAESAEVEPPPPG
jgi:hypothetical protein